MPYSQLSNDHSAFAQSQWETAFEFDRAQMQNDPLLSIIYMFWCNDMLPAKRNALHSKMFVIMMDNIYIYK